MAGDFIASVGSTYAVSSNGAEIAIATHPDHRRLGLAVAAAAGVVAMTLERGMVPAWHAANDASTAIAVRLGFEPAGRCDVFDVP